MTEKTEMAVSIMPKLETKIVELSSRLEQIMAERAPEAWEMAQGVIRVDALRDLQHGVTWLIVAGLCFWAFRWCLKHPGKNEDGTEKESSGFEGFVFVSAAGCLALSLMELLSIWTWTALINPELAIAKRILDGVL